MQLLIHVLFLFSGATALAYQVTWVRNLTLIFGASYQATSIVLASFMAGLCLGGFLFGRYSERIAHPLRTYAFLEIGIAVYALALPSLLGRVDTFYVEAALEANGVTPALSLLRLAMASGVLLPPTILMGATLPVLVSALVRRHSDFGARLSSLYGINTLGAVIGAVLTGFVLIPELGVWRTQVAAAAINVAIGALAWASDWYLAGARSVGPLVGSQHAAGSESQAPDGARSPLLEPPLRVGAHLAYRGAAVCGMCALALEVMWTRAVSISVGTTTYSFTVMLASFLVGIWLGSWLHAALPLRRIPASRQLGFTMVMIGLSSLVASYWIPRLPELVIQLNVALYGVGPRIRPVTTLLAGFAIMLVPCIFMGISFPLTGEARMSLGRAFGRSAGDTIGWNTLGSIAGAVLAGFVLIPYLGLQRGMILAAGIYVAYGCMVLGVPLVMGARRHPWAAAALATGVIAAAFFVPRLIPEWDVRRVGAFESNQLGDYVSRKGHVNVRDRLEQAVVVYYREGQASTISVVDMAGTFALLVNGKAVASDNVADMEVQLMLGHVPLLAHPDPKKALVVGLGAGFTLGSLTAHQSLEDITLVEIEPAVIAAQPLYAVANGDPFSDPRLRIEVQDGRNYLKTTRERFDVITADPIHPWNQGSGYLFTSEYYTTVKESLEDQGIMCQWLPTYSLSVENFKSIVATFDSVFPHTMLWHTGTDTVLIGSRAPFRFDLDRLASRLAEPAIEEQLSIIGIADPHAFLAEIALDSEDVREYASGGIINTDDNLYLEFASPVSIGTRETNESRRIINRYRGKPLRDSLFTALSETDRELVRRSREAKFQTMQIVLAKVTAGEKIRRLRQVLKDAPDYGPARMLLSRTLTGHGNREVQARRTGSAVRSLREAVELMPKNAGALRSLGHALFWSRRYPEAIEYLERSLILRPKRWSTLAYLGRAQLGAKRRQEAVESLRAAFAINPNRPQLAALLARILENPSSRFPADDSLRRD
jgi:spermidine synthase